jgi:hypothetical protein
MAISVMVRPAAASRGERPSAAMATPIIQIVTSMAKSGSVQNVLPDFLPMYIMYIPRHIDRELKKYSTVDQDILYHQTKGFYHGGAFFLYLIEADADLFVWFVP